MKKVLSVMALVCAMGFAACGGNEKNVGLSADEVKVGEYVTFGSYEQDNDKKNGKEPIEWLVLEVEDDRALLLSRYSLDNVAYTEEKKEITWEESYLREWLNKDFYKEAFIKSEKNAILETEISLYEDEDDAEEGASTTTEDKVFVLNPYEAWDYFAEGEEVDERGKRYNYSRAASATEYALEIAQMPFDYEYFDWWVMTFGNCEGIGTTVCDDGVIREGVAAICHCFVRPAIWVMLEETEE